MKALLVDYLTSSSKLSFNLESFLFSMRISKVYALFQHSNFGGVRTYPSKKLRRFWGSFEPIFNSFGRGCINFVYYPCQKNQKSAKIIPKVDEAFYSDRFLGQSPN